VNCNGILPTSKSTGPSKSELALSAISFDVASLFLISGVTVLIANPKLANLLCLSTISFCCSAI
jgi:hypothetical protein